MLIWHAVIGVGNVQDLVDFVSEHSAWQRIETDEVGDLARLWVLYDKRLNNIFSWQKEMGYLLDGILNVEAVLLEIVVEELVNSFGIFFSPSVSDQQCLFHRATCRS